MFTAQVMEVSKPLLRVSKLAKAGHTVVFAKGGSYIYDAVSGEVRNLEEVNGMYLLIRGRVEALKSPPWFEPGWPGKGLKAY